MTTRLPILKNHIALHVVTDWNELMDAIYLDQNIYVVTWERLHPCRWFMYHAKLATIREIFTQNAFIRVKPKNGQSYKLNS